MWPPTPRADSRTASADINLQQIARGPDGQFNPDATSLVAATSVITRSMRAYFVESKGLGEIGQSTRLRNALAVLDVRQVGSVHANLLPDLSKSEPQPLALLFEHRAKLLLHALLQ